MRRTIFPVRRLPVSSLVIALAGVLAAPARADIFSAHQPADFADMSIEELANIEITSVSRRPERLQDAPASVFVITADDIRRTAARSLPEALRLAPNLDVARISNVHYTISARGMNGSSGNPANKLLVLIDGRSVYSPLFSGVFWDEPEVMLEDVERIEVISGPGSTLWGVNAVNGVISITTRHSRDTRGDLVSLRADEQGAQAAFHHGGGSDGASWRVYGKTFGLKQSMAITGGPVEDQRVQAQVGLRADWEHGADRYGVSADASRATEGQTELTFIMVPGTTGQLEDVHLHDANVTSYFTRALEGGGSLSVHGGYEQRYRSVPPTFIDSVDIADLQFQHALPPFSGHSIVWGGEYRYSWDHVTNSRFVAFLPPDDKQAWAALFAQDEVALRPDLRLTVGARFERNPYTGAEFLPNLRLSWRTTPSHQFWAALSRTVRGPARLDVDGRLPGTPPYAAIGTPQVRSETARVFELGYRGQVGSGLSYSMAAFRNLYDHLRTQDVALVDGRPTVVLGNQMDGQARGMEAWANAQMSEGWRLSAGFTALHETFTLKPGSRDIRSAATQGWDPAYTVQLRSSYAIDGARDLDVSLRHVASRELADVPAYTALDVRFGWRLTSALELSVIGANLNGGHAEYGFTAQRTEAPRSLGVQVVFQR
jgi:iron complex outermembrane receptor protein